MNRKRSRKASRMMIISQRKRISPLMNSIQIFSLTSAALCPFLFCFSLFLSSPSSAEARDTITAVDPIHDRGLYGNRIKEQVVSAGGRFVLGFFTPTRPPPTSRDVANLRRYVGIWYRQSPATIVWVANRDRPINRSGGTLSISGDGRLQLRDARSSSLFSFPSVDQSLTNTSTHATLDDSGNLILRAGKMVLWRSFDHPTDTILPGMDISQLKNLTSWRTPGDPSTGNYTFAPQGSVQGQYVILKSKNQEVVWGSSELTTTLHHADDYSINDLLQQQGPSRAKSNTSHKIDFSELPRNVDPSNWRFVMDSSGKAQLYFSKNETKSGDNGNGVWVLYRQWPRSDCACGKFSMCTLRGDIPTCNCLPGYTPASSESWTVGHFSDGCQTEHGAGNCNSTFEELNVSSIMKEDHFTDDCTETECVTKCRSECHCQAYYFELNRRGRESNVSCWFWYRDLTHMEQSNSPHRLRVRGGVHSSARPGPASSSGSGYGSPSPRSRSHSSIFRLYVTFSAVAVVVLFSLIGGVVYFRSRRARRRKGRGEGIQQGNTAQFLHQCETRVKELMGPKVKSTHEGVDVPFFSLESILAATDDFSDANKLGKGGFGPVYKGTLQDGQQIAVKRLSSASGQGLEEFKNEVILIAKLQHRNLVRLLGYCTDGEEKILLYEYMPNKSLDAFIFDPSLRLALEWKQRFNIVLGIARGLLYLHQDSRLRIIHRDLKTSNILLDEEMNPKISDFGLAKIFGGKQTGGATDRVVGTYGYMSPEYALHGFFSVKSDVFSFGVILLEIISGKRNIDFYQSEGALNLLGHAWSLWREENASEFIDQSLERSCNVDEVHKCIQVGLLCVQEDPNDRPTMSTVVIMLSSDTMSLVAPKQPAFILRRGQPSATEPSTSTPDSNSNRTLTITFEDGR